MKKAVFEALYQKNGLMHKFDEAIAMLESIEKNFDELDNIDSAKLDQVIVYLVEKNLNTIDSFIILMRYFIVINRHELYIHLTKYTGFLDVIENILARLKRKVNLEVYSMITEGYKLPFLGVSPFNLPNYITNLMERLNKHLDEETINDGLAGNNHDISEKSQIPEKIAYEASTNLETYLKERHQRKVEELERHWKENRVWFEQTITKEVVDHVRNNQEVLSARLVDNKLYITKIPYDTLAYINAENLVDKQYYGCHCPFAREAIKANNNKVPAQFCYCSAGFAKFPFEVILGTKLAVKCLETILGGSTICRFEIDLTNIDYKK